MKSRQFLASCAVGFLAAVAATRGQMTGMKGMDMPTMDAFAGIPDARESSGTAWQPDTSPMYAQHEMLGDWMTMLHYNVFLNFDRQLGPRGGHQVDSENWAMLMASRRWDDNDDLLFRGMFSLEPWTVSDRGFPLLFQTGESYNGQPLVDRQHPHDFFMELAARYRHAFDSATAVSLYLAPSGEPALGPPAFMHRQSDMDDPAVPISHHWLDSTHISFGVATLGVSRGPFQLEGSWFNGREPDQNRWDIEPPHLDSYSGRLSWNPAPAWSAQVSYGYLASPEELHPEESEHRATFSVMNTHPLAEGRILATTVAWGQNIVAGERSNALLAESDWQVSRLYTIFGRAEYVEKTGEELNLLPEQRKFDVTEASLGASRELLQGAKVQLALGGEVTYSWAPSSLDALYGRHPVGYWIFLRLRPAKSQMKM
ncbi:MAG TPA: hypothetical protein VG672_05205 [Bryobacteraceae bacterium]|nr:hypothetical protein [Bryobacteraceae bacterium]